MVTIAGAEAGLTFFRERAEANAKEIAAAASGRATRAKTAASMALVPLPVKSPLVERPGVDEYGYPRSYVDQAALRSLLGRKKYEELSLHVEEFQAKFESDFHAEYLVRAVTDAFGSPEAELGPERMTGSRPRPGPSRRIWRGALTTSRRASPRAARNSLAIPTPPTSRRCAKRSIDSVPLVPFT